MSTEVQADDIRVRSQAFTQLAERACLLALKKTWTHDGNGLLTGLLVEVKRDANVVAGDNMVRSPVHQDERPVSPA